MIYFDSAATTYPKPASVRSAAADAIVRYGGNPGRSGHKLSISASSAVYSVREKAAQMFGAEPQNVVFTLNCTHSINIAVKGIAEEALREKRDFHVIISNLEHNSVARPVYEMTKRGLTYSIAEVHPDDDVTVMNFERLITQNSCRCLYSGQQRNRSAASVQAHRRDVPPPWHMLHSGRRTGLRRAACKYAGG